MAFWNIRCKTCRHNLAEKSSSQLYTELELTDLEFFLNLASLRFSCFVSLDHLIHVSTDQTQRQKYAGGGGGGGSFNTRVCADLKSMILGTISGSGKGIHFTWAVWKSYGSQRMCRPFKKFFLYNCTEVPVMDHPATSYDFAEPNLKIQATLQKLKNNKILLACLWPCLLFTLHV